MGKKLTNLATSPAHLTPGLSGMGVIGLERHEICVLLDMENPGRNFLDFRNVLEGGEKLLGNSLVPVGHLNLLGFC